MKYYYSKTIEETDFESAIKKTTEALQEEGFGVLTEIDVKTTFKKKLNLGFKNFKILGACNPIFAYKALQMEKNIGVFLPCNVVVEQEREGDPIKVSVVNPVASMAPVKNTNLANMAEEIAEKLQNVLATL